MEYRGALGVAQDLCHLFQRTRAMEEDRRVSQSKENYTNRP